MLLLRVLLLQLGHLSLRALVAVPLLAGSLGCTGDVTVPEGSAAGSVTGSGGTSGASAVGGFGASGGAASAGAGSHAGGSGGADGGSSGFGGFGGFSGGAAGGLSGGAAGWSDAGGSAGAAGTGAEGGTGGAGGTPPVGGSDGSPCGPEETDCGGLCADLDADPLHCGACENACTAENGEPSCKDGACGIGSCDSWFADCDADPATGCEINLLHDDENCGSCGTACDAGTCCQAAYCSYPECGSGNYDDCDGICENGCETSLNSVGNCGFCGNVCSLPNAVPTCKDYMCAIGSCLLGFGDCDGLAANGCESDVSKDRFNCGTCGNTCDGCCGAGKCGSNPCNVGTADCDGWCGNGCEVALTTNQNCGWCGNVCNAPNATTECAGGGWCAVTQCDAGYADCDGLDANGCEVNLATDPQNCGACGSTCSLPNASAGCNGGTCTVVGCDLNFGDCDDVTANGCEVDLSDDESNCGACGKTCSAFEQCCHITGPTKCWELTCSPGFASCDGNHCNGCETSVFNDAVNCGKCGKSCLVPHAKSACFAGVCMMSTCDPGYADCDGQLENGCETDLAHDEANCGACGAPCPSLFQQCCGTCVSPSCGFGFGDCDGDFCSSPCETSLFSNLDNCGSCGNACIAANGTAECVGIQCVIASCAPDKGDCDLLYSTGCEVDLLADEQHCGACDVSCTSGQTCIAGSCT